MRSIFATDRTVKTKGQVASSEYALVNIGGRSELGQSVSGNYGRQIQTIFELGSPAIMWVAGHEQGTLAFQRLVGAKGFFSGWEGESCGEIRPVSVNLGGGPCVAAASGGLAFSTAMIEGLTFGMTAGQLEIQEGINLRIANMSRV